MALFGNRPHDFGSGAVTSQSDRASPPPDVLAVVAAAITEGGRPGVATSKVLAAVDRVLSAQMDVYAAQLAAVDGEAVRRMRRVLRGRPDFRYEMFFAGLTYFGPGGVAMANGLAEQLAVFVPELVTLIRAGHFDGDGDPATGAAGGAHDGHA